ncbi:MAG: bifunctional UDP-N-acetylglucosamine diphosphorylase/glucosamine-1-phosphate N-acetyltransferase GlmU [Firmicutes bacterium]|nr:bifunctional UDP-N-acetylglucosamine diphosphorylase/glucosamine-1-phosphate N-acetyltransferase GlmU [Bacillota bacterium]
MNDFAAVILAAGKGTRMKSALPKVLHQIAGQSLVQYAVDAAKGAGAGRICLVVGHGAEQVQEAMGEEYLYAVQEQQLGTGHALQTALPAFSQLPAALLVLCGDTPLLTAETLSALAQQFFAEQADCTVMSAVLPDGGNYGRILRDEKGGVCGIIEARDSTPEQLAIREINSGVYCFRTEVLLQVIGDLRPNNDQGELYLTDVLASLHRLGRKVTAFVCPDANEILGVNDRAQLAELTALMRKRINRRWMLEGVTMIDPETVYIDAKVEIGPDTILEPQVYLHGNTVIGSGCKVGPGVKVVDSQVGDQCILGPFTYLRPGTVLAEKVKAGHFVEIKKSRIGKGSKVPHLSYIGDTIIGEGVNIGCGTITCNYDGVHKHTTVIEDQAFIGSNTNLVPPVTVGKRSTVAAGSTITEDVPADSLAIARGHQRNIEGWTLERDPRFAKKEEK